MTQKANYNVHLIGANGELSTVRVPNVTWKALKIAARRIASEHNAQIHYTERAA